MELSISDSDARTIGIDSPTKEKIVGLAHRYLGLASVAFVELVEDPPAVSIRTHAGTIYVDRELTRRIDN